MEPSYIRFLFTLGHALYSAKYTLIPSRRLTSLLLLSEVWYLNFALLMLLLNSMVHIRNGPNLEVCILLDPVMLR